MPLETTADNAPTEFPKPDVLTLESLKRGVITLVDKSHLPKDAAEEMTNLFRVEDGQASIRPGVDWFGTAPTTTTSTGVSIPSAAAGTSWTNPTNVYTSNDAYAVFATTTQLHLRMTDFGLDIPTGATILGFTITVEGNGTNATAGNRSIEVGLTKDGTILASAYAASQNLNQTTDTTLTFGSASSLFSIAWTAA